MDPAPRDLMDARWSPEQAQAWQRRLGWLSGANYLPASAGNQLEMFAAETFDPEAIDRELGWARQAGLNSLRIFLHDLLWEHDRAGLLARLDRVLGIAGRHGLGVLPVFFDSCWHPYPQWGPQRGVEPGVHNSLWLQSPGAVVLRDPSRFAALAGYVGGVIGHFRDDPRIQGWDLWNEPCNGGGPAYGSRDLEGKATLIAHLLPEVFRWARAARPSQPLTSGVWNGGDWGDDRYLTPIQRVQLHASDVVSFHSYQKPAETLARIRSLGRFGRPLWCTEYMARPTGSTIPALAPLLQEHGVGAWQWGLVQGRSQTHLAWDTWKNPCPGEPAEWFHDLFRGDGTPYRAEEIAILGECRARAGIGGA